jgi:hypothetical protein
VSPRLIHFGSGVARDVVVFYALSDLDHARSLLWPEACALADWTGPYAIVSPDDIEPLGHVIARARREAGPFRVRTVVLIGYGAGCRAIREQIRDGARPDVIVALDGVAGPPGPIPPDEYHLGPWRVVADRARRSDCLAVLTHTSQTFMEALPPGQRYASSLTVLREITNFELASLGPGDPPVQTRSGGLVVQSYPSRTLDRVAHAAQRTFALPRIVTDLVRPWIADADVTPTSLPRWQL